MTDPIPESEQGSVTPEEFLKLQLKRQGIINDTGDWTFSHPTIDAAKERSREDAKQQAVSMLDSKKDKTPHKWMKFVRGVPMGEGLPSMNLPPEAQNALARHLEAVGFEHNPEKQTLKHRAPDQGPDISINPGTWVPINEEELVTQAATLPVPDLTGTHPDQLMAMEEAIYNERIRILKHHHSDIPNDQDPATPVVQQFTAVPLTDLTNGVGE